MVGDSSLLGVLILVQLVLRDMGGDESDDPVYDDPQPDDGVATKILYCRREGFVGLVETTKIHESGDAEEVIREAFCGFNLQIQLGTWKERWKHEGKRSCADRGVLPSPTNGTSDNVDVPLLHLQEDVEY